MFEKLKIILVILGFIGLFALSSSSEVVVQAVRTDSIPVIDGKLTDSCWQKAVPITNFLSIDSNIPATYQTIGYVLYDDTNLYIGIKCSEPNISNIKTEVRKYENELFRDDVVEIMIDPGLSRIEHFQFAVNASGSKYDCFYKEGGAFEDEWWSGDWEAVSFIGDNYWTCEVRIPFYTLGISSKVGSTWGINLCREKQNPSREYSTIVERIKAFNITEKFVKLQEIDANLSEYCYSIGEPKVSLEIINKKLYARLNVPIKNESNVERKVKIERIITDKSEKVSIKSEDINFKGNEEKNVSLELLEIKPTTRKNTGKYLIVTEPETKKIKISDVDGKKIFAISDIKVEDLYTVIEVKITNPKETELEIIANLSGEELKKCNFSVEIREVGKSEILLEKIIIEPTQVTKIKLSDWKRYKKVPSGKLIARAVIKDLKGEVIAEANTTFVKLEGKAKKLNNLVMELLNVKNEETAGSYKEYKFENPKDGWVFISTTAEIKEKGKIFVSIDSMSKEEPIIVYDKTGVEILEAMRLLLAGEHKVKIWSEGNASFSLIVRGIPELLFRSFRIGPPVSGYEPLDYWEFLQKHVVKNINCMICGSGGFVNDRNIMSIVEGWKKQGKKWIHECGAPGQSNTPVGDITPEEAYSYWSNQPGFQNPLLDGILVDEFLGRFAKEKYEAWTKAVRMLYDNEKFRGKTFYPYCAGGLVYTEKKIRKFIDAIIEADDYKIAWEVYLQEQPTETEADKYMKSKFRQYMLGWENKQPGVREKMIMVLGYLSLPVVENLNVYPGVDYKVFMDMQFNLIANDPAFSGLYGVEEYSSSYAEEETVRWASQLFRHYCIEGRTEMLSKKYGFKYMLDHIENPDFDNGTNGWTLTPAETGSIDAKNMEKYSWLQGRWPRTTQGDTFLWMKRSKNGPNVISQEIKNLIQGNLYSIKIITADYNDISKGISKKEKHAVSININNVELIPNKYFQEILGSMHDLGSFKDNHKAWMNYHWKVFRAKGTSAKLTISDWINDKEPGGPIGQELMFNYIEVQPYFE